jgi:hypothetical protein
LSRVFQAVRAAPFLARPLQLLSLQAVPLLFPSGCELPRFGIAIAFMFGVAQFSKKEKKWWR